MHGPASSGAIMLGFGRALGETMAVTMVIGNNPQISLSLFQPQYTMAAVLANEFTEAADELYLHALIEVGLVLFVITLLVNGASRLLIWSMNRAPAPRKPVRRGSSGGRGRMNWDAYRKAKSTVVVWLCGLSVLHCVGTARVHSLLRRQPGHSLPQSRVLHQPARSRG